ncbi:plasmid mobilization protein [Leptolyngbya sp. AN02str]|uniref:plasmid mobilization protein n=1 Tax=Leptolyngbya sp. AN02str TaxID=3423363 RepID=UPI003D30EFB8
MIYTLIVLPNGITMAREKRLNIRVTDEEWDKLKTYADKKGLSMAEVIRFYISSLPGTDR